MTQQEAFELAMRESEVKIKNGSAVDMSQYLNALVKNLQQVKK